MRLDYTKDYQGNGLTYYNFTLTLDNQDSSWAPGQSWGWLIFGDAPSLGDGAFANFTLISSSGNWNQVSMPNGPYNGVLLGPVTQFWTPGQVGDSISWRGSSTSDVQDSAMFFSSLVAGGGAAPISHKPADNVSPDKPPPFFFTPVDSSSSSSSGGGTSSSSSGGGDVLPDDPLAAPEPATVLLTTLALTAVAFRRKS